jgi:hypothetical protein
MFLAFGRRPVIPPLSKSLFGASFFARFPMGAERNRVIPFDEPSI